MKINHKNTDKIIFTINILLSKYKTRRSHQMHSMKKGVLRNFAKFTEKHLCQSFFLVKL